MFCIRILILCFVSISSICGMAADDRSVEEKHAQKKDLFDWNGLPQDCKDCIIKNVIEDIFPSPLHRENVFIRMDIVKGIHFDAYISPSGEYFIADEEKCRFGTSNNGSCKEMNVYSSDSETLLWKMDTDGYEKLLGCSDAFVAAFYSVDDGRDVSGKIDIYDLKSGKKLKRDISLNSDLADSVEFNADNTQLAVKQKEVLTVHDIKKGTNLATWRGCEGKNIISWHPTQNALILSDSKSGNIQIREADTFETIVEFNVPQGYTWMAVSPSGHQVAGMSEDHYICIYHRNTGRLEKTKYGMPSCSDMKWHFSGNTLFAVGFRVVGELNFDLGAKPKEYLEQQKFTYYGKKKSKKGLFGSLKRYVSRSKKSIKEDYTKKLHPLYISALVSRISEAIINYEKIGLCAEEQLYFASLPKELQKGFINAIKMRDISKIPFGKSIYTENHPQFGPTALSHTDSDAASEEQGHVGDKQEASDSDA